MLSFEDFERIANGLKEGLLHTPKADLTFQDDVPHSVSSSLSMLSQFKMEHPSLIEATLNHFELPLDIIQSCRSQDGHLDVNKLQAALKTPPPPSRRLLSCSKKNRTTADQQVLDH